MYSIRIITFLGQISQHVRFIPCEKKVSLWALIDL